MLYLSRGYSPEVSEIVKVFLRVVKSEDETFMVRVEEMETFEVGKDYVGNLLASSITKRLLFFCGPVSYPFTGRRNSPKPFGLEKETRLSPNL